MSNAATHELHTIREFTEAIEGRFGSYDEACRHARSLNVTGMFWWVLPVQKDCERTVALLEAEADEAAQRYADAMENNSPRCAW